MRERSSEQKLVDILFECVMMMHDKEYGKALLEADRDDLAAWVRRQLDGCGFPNVGPMGMSWCVLKSELEKRND